MSLKIKISILAICFALLAAVCVGFAFAAPSEKLNLKGTLSYDVPRPVVTASPNDPDLGSTTGSGDYSIGETVTLTATKKSGSTFLAWATSTDPNEMEILSTSRTYSFELSPDSPRTYYALFNKTTPTSQTVGNLIYTFYNEAKLAEVTAPTSKELSSVEILPVVKSGENSYKIFSIGNSAFSGCSSLTEITIPEGVTSIGNSAFQLCSNLTSVSLPSTLTSIGNSAFQSCSSLTEIEIPEEVTSIGERAFRYCDNLTSITIPEGVTLIGNNAFQLCSSLTSVSLPSTLTSIGENAFESCDSLTKITIPKGVTSIGESTFFSCTSLTSVSIPSTLTSIGDRAFKGCSQLTTITIPEGVTFIGGFAFQNCYALAIVYNNSSLNITAGSTGSSYVGYYAKEVVSSGEEAVGEIVVEGNVQYYVNATTGENIALAPSVSRDSLISITIREKTTEIGERAFYGCSSLTSVTIPEGVTSIGGSAFWGCSSLTEITIPVGVTSIGQRAFSGCDNLSSITIPEKVTKIDSFAFENCENLISVTISGNITSLGTSVFAGCDKLTSLTLGAGVENLPTGLFTGNNLTELTEIEVLGDLNSLIFPSGTWYKNNDPTPVTSFDGEGVYTRTDV